MFNDTVDDFFIFSLILLCGVVLGFLLAILRAAFVFPSIKKIAKLKDGEVMIMSEGRRQETWLNAKTILGSFHAILLALIPFSNSRHILHKKSTMLTTSIIMATVCVLFSTSAYATFYHYSHKHAVRKKIEKPVYYREFKKPTVNKAVEVKQDTDVVKSNVKPTSVTTTNKPTIKPTINPDIKPVNNMIESSRDRINDELIQKKEEDNHQIAPERHRGDCVREHKIVRIVPDVPQKVEDAPRNLVQNVTQNVTHTVTDTVTKTVSNTVNTVGSILKSL